MSKKYSQRISGALIILGLVIGGLLVVDAFAQGRGFRPPDRGTLDRGSITAEIDSDVTAATGGLHTTLSAEIDTDVAAGVTAGTGGLHTTVSAEIDEDVTAGTGGLHTTVSAEIDTDVAAGVTAGTGGLHTTVSAEIDTDVTAGTGGLHTTVSAEIDADIDLVRTTETKVAIAYVGNVAASQEKYIFVAPYACTIVAIGVVCDTTTSGSDDGTNYEFQVANLTISSNLCAVATNTGETELTGDAYYNLGVDNVLTLAADEVLELQITSNGTPTALSAAEVIAVTEYY